MATQVLDHPARSKKPQAGTVNWLTDCIARGKREVFTETILMTPALATIILRNNPDNRTLKPVKLGHFIADMVSDRWAFNGQPIILSKDGLLNDGQHRLTALCEANVTLPMRVEFGLERDTRTTIDQGTARTAGDYLHMEGGAYANSCASITRVLLAYEQSDGRHIREAGKFTNSQILSRVHSDPAILAAAEYASHVSKHTSKFAAPAIIGSAFYILSEIHPSEARQFMDGIALGEGMRLHQPIHTTRETLLKMGKGARQTKLEVIFHGWNKYRNGGSLKIIRVNGNFPALV